MLPFFVFLDSPLSKRIMKIRKWNNHYAICNRTKRKTTIKFPWCTNTMPVRHFSSCSTEIVYYTYWRWLCSRWHKRFMGCDTIYNINFIRHPDCIKFCYTLHDTFSSTPLPALGNCPSVRQRHGVAACVADTNETETLEPHAT